MARNDAVGKARYITEVDPSGIDKGLAQTSKRIKDTGTQTEKAFAQQGQGALSKFGTTLKGLDDRLMGMSKRGGISGALLGGFGMGAGLGVFNTVQNLVSGAMDKIGQGIDLASDKAESASKANVLFGDSYGIVEKASRTAASTVAMSSGAYLAAAGDVGNLITNMGIAGDQAANMSVDMLQLAADMGSFSNASPEEVIEAIGSAFRGETEPIRRFGVMLSAAKIEQKALAMGLKDGKKPLTDYGKAMATYQLILDQTGAAQGDLARTADGLANKQRLAAARQEEALTRLGDALLPLANELLPALADAGTAAVEILTSLIGAAKSLWGAVRDVDEFIKPWQKGARLAREEVIAWADELQAMPQAAGIGRQQLESIALEAQKAGEGLAGAKKELIDLVRWINATKNGGGDQLVGMLRNFEKWSDLLDEKKITVEQFDAKVRAMARGGLKELEENLDLLPPALADVVRSFTDGSDAVDIFVAQFIDAGKRATQSGDWARWSQFLQDNADLVREHWEQLPKWIQDALLEGGVVAAQAAGDVTLPLYRQFLTDAQRFWTGAGGAVFLPPAPTPAQLQLVQDAADRVTRAFHLDFSSPARKGMSGAFRFIENNLGPGLKGAILSAKDDVDKAMDEVRWVINHPKKWAEAVSDTETAIRRLMRARDRALANGKEPLARYLEGQLGMFVGNWEQLTGVAWDEALSVGENFRKGLLKKKKPIGDAADDIVLAAEGPIKTAAGRAYKWGSRYAINMARGMNDNASLVDTAAGDLAQVAKDHHKTSSPSKRGPWSTEGGPEGWGRKYARLIARGIHAGRAEVAMASSMLAGAAPGVSGWSMTASATQTVRHEHGGTVQVELSPASIAAARDQGASWEDVGRMARAAAAVSDVLSAAQRRAGTTYLAPAGRPI